MPDPLPEFYQSLVSRVEQIEQILSKKAFNDKPNTLAMTDDRLSHDQRHMTQIEIDDDLNADKVDPVVITSRAFLKVAIHAKKYAHSKLPRDEWVEVIGLLTGHIVNENTPNEQIVINEAWPVGHGDAVSAEILHTASVTTVLDDVNKNFAGDFIVGWYHSHPSYTPFLSETDYATQGRYQSLWSKAIALVVDPVMISQSHYGFGVYRNTVKEQGNKGYSELSTFVDGISPRAAYDTIEMLRPALEGKDPAQEFIEYDSLAK